ncbi:hypothetical protein BGZ83_001183 [Gryganskiella cystojenkinii]|nr:hypothetical protein BGZ83_001183 [Gryganskiella cystojenkinii]
MSQNSPSPQPRSSLLLSPSGPQHGDALLTDVLNKLQVLKALTKQQDQTNKPTIPLLAQACSLLDNLPMPSPKKPTSMISQAGSVQWTTEQEQHIKTLRMSAWKDMADGCIRASDFIQAEVCLQKLAKLQAEAAGPLGEKPSSKPKNEDQTAIVPTQDQCLNAAGLVLTWDTLSKVFGDMGKQDMAINYAKRRDKLGERLSNHISTIT